jgi:hypothetical protein
MSARKLSKGTIELSASSGSPLPLIASRRLLRSKKPGRPTAFPRAAHDRGTPESDLHGVRQYFFEVPYDPFIAVCQNSWDLLYINAVDGWKDRLPVRLTSTPSAENGKAFTKHSWGPPRRTNYSTFTTAFRTWPGWSPSITGSIANCLRMYRSEASISWCRPPRWIAPTKHAARWRWGTAQLSGIEPSPGMTAREEQLKGLAHAALCGP